MKSRGEFTNPGTYKRYMVTYFSGVAMQGILAMYSGSDSGPDTEYVTETSIKYAEKLFDKLNERYAEVQ